LSRGNESWRRTHLTHLIDEFEGLGSQGCDAHASKLPRLSKSEFSCSSSSSRLKPSRPRLGFALCGIGAVHEVQIELGAALLLTMQPRVMLLRHG